MNKTDKQELSRRSLIKWSLFAGAALGIGRSKVYQVVEDTFGREAAAEASCLVTNRSVHIAAGTGGFAWYQLLWPHNDVVAGGNQSAAFHAFGQTHMATGTDRPLTMAPQTPFKSAAGNKQITALMAGANETHTRTPSTATNIGGNSLLAVAAALQVTNPSVIPVVTVDGSVFGTAPGAPRPSAVGTAEQFVGLFNSAASRAGGLLENTDDASLYDAHYAALASLNRAANRPTTSRAYTTAKTAAHLLGTNLATQLAITDADRMRYGVAGAVRQNLKDLAETLIVTAKAFRMGLTSSVCTHALGDDPHGAFNDPSNPPMTAGILGGMLDAFIADLAATPDPSCAGTSLADNVIMTIHGDTPKTPLVASGWPDGTPGNSNWMYVYGNGWLKTGWFGGIMRDGTTKGYDPATGQENGTSSAQLAAPASAAVAYAIAKGDMRRVGDFARGINIQGLIRPVTQ
ncbi:MAG TPA: hypothetical protein VHE35_35675 [Kofleriaceae bacterium]|nr:hypothetical protein [Kofleriaceae bacterium]